MRASAFAAVACLVGASTWAQQHDEKERQELAKALKGVKVTLEKGLLASEREGKPISAKFEVQKGEIVLSVYTIQGDGYREINVDPRTGEIAKFESIRGGGDLAEARTQSEAFGKARLSLRTATEKAVKSNPGFRAVNVSPSTRNGRAIADLTLLKGNQFKTVSERLE